MNLKSLQEKRNELLSQADALVALAETEVRSFNSDENTTFDNLTKEIADLNSQILEVEDQRSAGTKINPMEATQMTDIKELEVRGLEQYLRKEDGEEQRTLQKTTDGGAVIPENVEGSIIQKMEETSPVFARARKFASVAGTLKIAKETANTVAGFVGEGADVAESGISLEEVKLTQKRVGAAISLSNQLINDAAVQVVDYSMNLLSRRVAKAVEKSMLVGSTGDEFRGIKGSKVPQVEVTSAGALTIDTFMDLYNAVHPEFLDGSSFIMSRNLFNQVAKLKDGNGHFYLQNGLVNGRLTYTLLGAEVIVTDALDKGTAATEVPAIFGNIEQAYAVMIKKGFALQHVTADTTQALRGSQLLVMDGYMDGEVYNEQALAKLVVTA